MSNPAMKVNSISELTVLGVPGRSRVVVSLGVLLKPELQERVIGEWRFLGWTFFSCVNSAESHNVGLLGKEGRGRWGEEIVWGCCC